MTGFPQAIETKYDGCRFRSRLEARWAVFFKTHGIRYEYEPEGFDLRAIYKKLPAPHLRERNYTTKQLWYLPDFWLPDYEYYIEIKPVDGIDTLAADHCWLLKFATGKNVGVIAGSPGTNAYEFFVIRTVKHGDIGPYAFAEGRYCDRLWFVADDGKSEPLRCGDCCWSPRCGDADTWPHRGLERSYEAARSERFGT